MLQIAILQFNIIWEQKETNLKTLAEKLLLLKAGTQLVVLPEMFTTGFSMAAEKLAESMEGKTVAWMKQMASEYKIILTGSIIIKEQENYYNRMLWVLPNGVVHHYNKRHLFGMAKENEVYTAGNTKLLVQANGLKLNLQICYDLRFPVWNRQASNAELADVIIYVANWPTKRIEHWNILLRARALENQCYVLACNRVGSDANSLNYSGHSQILGPSAELIDKIIGSEGYIYASLDDAIITATRKKLPFLQDADSFTIL